MSRKDVTDQMVCCAVDLHRQVAQMFGYKKAPWPYEILAQFLGEPEKVCYRAMERACDRELLDYGVSLRSGWLTKKGHEVLRNCRDQS